MLKSLSINNYALIDKLDIAFGDQLTILTGETGAGKSIILGALSLILGKRADTSVLMDREGKCIIEGTFDVRPYKLKKVFDQLDVDYEEMTVVRREINANGKSRAFVNDTPVNLNDLKDLVSLLIDIHSQHQTLELNSAEFQRGALDHFAGLDGEIINFRTKFSHFRSLENRLKDLQQQESDDKAQQDYMEFQFRELDEAKLQEGEEESLEEELKILSHTEEVKHHLQLAISSLSEDERNAISLLGEASHAATKAAAFLSKLEEGSTRLESALIEIRDIANELENAQQELVHDPERLEFVRERLDLLNSLQHKHKVVSVKELIELRERFNRQLSGVFDKELEIGKLQKELDAVRKDLETDAKVITGRRQEAIPRLEEEISGLLRELGMKEAVFTIRMETAGALNEYGADEIEFLFSANKGIAPMPMSKVASGGELSRLMLSLKSVIARKIALPTIVFDEIDTGISGEIADRTGRIIKRIAKGTQVICITHLPQMASKGDMHYLVYKDAAQQPPKTHIKPLSEEERIKEIAKMLSGETLTQQAIENAKVLLNA